MNRSSVDIEAMIRKCARCPKRDSQAPGESCVGPNFFAMPQAETVAWMKERKNYMGLTNAKLAELSGMAHGTVDSVLANKQQDFKIGTISPMLRVLVGSEWNVYPCLDQETDRDSVLQEEIDRLKLEINQRDERIKKNDEELKWRDDKIKYLETEHTRTLEDLSGRVSRHQANQEFLRAEIKSKNEEIDRKNEEIERKIEEVKKKDKTIAILTALFGIALVIIAAALIADKRDPSKGFFWLTSWLKQTRSPFSMNV